MEVGKLCGRRSGTEGEKGEVLASSKEKLREFLSQGGPFFQAGSGLSRRGLGAH